MQVHKGALICAIIFAVDAYLWGSESILLGLPMAAISAMFLWAAFSPSSKAEEKVPEGQL